MRFMIIRKADKDTEAGVLPSEALLGAMLRYNEEMVKAGVMLAGEGLHPSAKGAKVKFKGGKPTVIDGPFTETKELIAGFSMIQVKSREEAIEWVKRWPAELRTARSSWSCGRCSRRRISARSSRPSCGSRRNSFESRRRGTKRAERARALVARARSPAGLKKLRRACRFRQPSFDVSSERGTERPNGPDAQLRTEPPRRRDDEVHDAGQGEREE
jgi:hypothetical protein